MARLTITLSDERRLALREAAAKRRKTIGQLIEESLGFYGIKTMRIAEQLVAKARARAALSEADAMRIAVTKPARNPAEMKYAAVVIDANVVVAALLTGHARSPTIQILDAMCRGAFPFLLSTALLAEYREVMLRKKIRSLHDLGEREVDLLLTLLAANAIVRESAHREGAPDANDAHVWSLVHSEANCVLVTDDQALVDHLRPGSRNVSPRQFVALLAK